MTSKTFVERADKAILGSGFNTMADCTQNRPQWEPHPKCAESQNRKASQ